MRDYSKDELSDLNKQDPPLALDNFIEELADVDIMIGQMKHLCKSCGWDKQFQKMKEEKLIKLQKMLRVSIM